MDNEEDILYKILLSREMRVEKQRYLIDKHKCSLISFTLNIPGPVKDSILYRKTHKEGMSQLIKRLTDEYLNICCREESYEETGAEGFLCVDGEGFSVKRITTALEENHELGRIFDFDVFDNTGKSISRKDLGLDLRKCLLCDEKALVCKRKKEHTTEELLKKIEIMTSNYFKKEKGNRINMRKLYV